MECWSVKPVKELVGAPIQKLQLKEQPLSGMFMFIVLNH